MDNQSRQDPGAHMISREQQHFLIGKSSHNDAQVT